MKKKALLLILPMGMLFCLFFVSCGTSPVIPPVVLTLLKDLGAEGNLTIAGNVYNIINNTASTGKWSVSFKKSELPEPEKSGTHWKITLKEKEYVFWPNPFNADICETDVPDTETTSIEEIRNSFFETIE